MVYVDLLCLISHSNGIKDTFKRYMNINTIFLCCYHTSVNVFEFTHIFYLILNDYILLHTNLKIWHQRIRKKILKDVKWKFHFECFFFFFYIALSYFAFYGLINFTRNIKFSVIMDEKRWAKEKIKITCG